MKQKILIAKHLPHACIEPYIDRFDFTMPDQPETAFTYEQILQMLPEYDGYLDVDIIADRPVIDAAVENGIKAIANYGVGYDKIDWKYATERGLPILNTPTSVTPDAAVTDAMTKMLSGAMQGDGRRNALLAALRPFLRPERQHSLDRAMQAAKLSGLARLVLQNLESR